MCSCAPLCFWIHLDHNNWPSRFRGQSHVQPGREANLKKLMTISLRNSLVILQPARGRAALWESCSFDVPLMIHNNTAPITVWGESRSVLQGLPKNALSKLQFSWYLKSSSPPPALLTPSHSNQRTWRGPLKGSTRQSLWTRLHLP